MRGQDSQANCGPYALLNALRALGIQRTAEELEALCGTTMTKGTSPGKLLAGARRVEGLTPTKLRERRREVALLRLHGAVSRGRPALLVWSSEGKPGEHWVAVVGLLGERYLIADAAENELVLSMEVDEVVQHWEDHGTYEGILL
jgi:ABC-type bacteriocin/lantibiotic exporter with double-glycine peptidase domain